MFLVGYYNDTNFFVTLGIYPLSSNSTPVAHFQNIKGGSFIETTDCNLFSGHLLSSSNSAKPLLLNNILPNSNMDRPSQPVLNQLSNNLTITATYDRPSDDRVIVFHAINNFGEAAFKEKIEYEENGELSWYWVLGLLVGVVVGMVVVCVAYRRWRIRRGQREKESLLSEQMNTERLNTLSEKSETSSSDRQTV